MKMYKIRIKKVFLTKLTSHCKKERRINLELRKPIDKIIECKGDSCEIRKLLETVRVVEKFHKAFGCFFDKNQQVSPRT